MTLLEKRKDKILDIKGYLQLVKESRHKTAHFEFTLHLCRNFSHHNFGTKIKEELQVFGVLCLDLSRVFCSLRFFLVGLNLGVCSNRFLLPVSLKYKNIIRIARAFERKHAVVEKMNNVLAGFDPGGFFAAFNDPVESSKRLRDTLEVLCELPALHINFSAEHLYHILQAFVKRSLIEKTEECSSKGHQRCDCVNYVCLTT
mmetsp:Transcript_26609/g.64400  ORF Transcript_26609/g.64400 Transcript_26609/m.64400 type:complete len:201 (-) Transcript_26609:4066-4668(-)